MRDNKYKVQQHSMKKQNEELEDNFIIEKECAKGPLHLLTFQRIMNLENKVTFFQGQFDPLQVQNLNLRESIVRLSRSISLNTNVLRRLLPVQFDPKKKMRLEMATFEDVTVLIDQNWKVMEKEILTLLKSQSALETVQQEWIDRFKQQQTLRQRDRLQYQSEKLQLDFKVKSEISSLKSQIDTYKSDVDILTKDLEKEQRKNEKLLQSLSRELQVTRYEFSCKSKEYESCITRLKNNLEAVQYEYEQGKASLKALYEKLSNEKLNEQGETYELMLKIKEEEKCRIEGYLHQLKEMHQKELDDKDQDVRRMYDQLERSKQYVSEIEEELYIKREEMKEIKMNMKGSETDLIISKENCRIFEANLAKKELVIADMEKQYRQMIQIYEKRIKDLEQNHSQVCSTMELQIKSQTVQFDTQNRQLQSWKSKVQTMEQSYNNKIRFLFDNQQGKEIELLKSIQKLEKMIQNQKQSKFNLQRQKQEKQQKLKDYYQQLLKRQQKDFYLKRQEYMKEQTIKNSKFSSKTEEEVISVRMQYQIELQNERRLKSQEIKRIEKEMLSKMNELDTFSLKQKRKYEDRIVSLQDDKRSLNEEMSKLNKKMMQSEEKMEKMKGNHIREITKLQQKNGELILTWQNMMETQLNEFQKVLLERQMKFGQLEEKMCTQRQQLNKKIQESQKDLNIVRNNIDKEVNKYKESTGIQEIEKKFRSEIYALKASALKKERELQASFEEQRRSWNENHTKDKDNLISFYNGELNRAEEDFQEALIEISLSLFQTINTVDEHNGEIEREGITTMGRPAKLEYIHDKIKEVKSLIQQKMQQALETTGKLSAFEQSLEEELKVRKQEIENERMETLRDIQTKMQAALSEFNSNIHKKEEEYKLKSQQLQKERTRFVELLYEEFKLLTANHEHQYSKLMKRYNELQYQLFHRPSRGQDTLKIKQLTNTNSKLSREILKLQKSLETANEIVKYLNLQLENYKEMYDIFGPNSDIGNKTISFGFDEQKAEKYKKMANRMKDVYSKSLVKDRNMEVKVTPFFEERQAEDKKAQRKTIEDTKNLVDLEVKDIKVFGEREEEGESFVLSPKQSQRKSRKYSLIGSKKGHPRFRTQKSPSKDKEILEHSETFLKLIGEGKDPALHDAELESKKHLYRRRRIKRFTSGVEQIV